VYLTNDASLIGFTLLNGATLNTGDTNQEQSGGGVWCESTNALVSNCIFATNSAQMYGGAAYSGSLSNCVLTGNIAGACGGGAYQSILTGCSLLTNYITASSSSGKGGGAFGCTLTNCSLFGNNANY